MTPQRAALLATATALLGFGTGWLLWHASQAPRPVPVAAAASAPANVPASDPDPTRLYAHNLELRKGPTFRVYISWIRGQLMRTNPAVDPSLDDPESFILGIEKGVIRANIGDISNYLNADVPSDSPLKNISVQPKGDQLLLRGTLHKIVPMPIELQGTLGPTPDGRVQFHVTRLEVLKLPLKGLFGLFHVQLSDLVHSSNIPGVQIAGNDIFFDTEKLLPPPHIHGQLTSVKVHVPDIEVVYGGVTADSAELARWHNFLKLSGGTLGFGKLTMHHVDLTLIDATPDAWFDLDLVNYQAQLVNGYTRMTAQAGLEIYMPDYDGGSPKRPVQAVTLEWLKNRNQSLPPDVKVK